jgi:hypothetical protein
VISSDLGGAAVWLDLFSDFGSRRDAAVREPSAARTFGTPIMNPPVATPAVSPRGHKIQGGMRGAQFAAAAPEFARDAQPALLRPDSPIEAN